MLLTVALEAEQVAMAQVAVFERQVKSWLVVSVFGLLFEAVETPTLMDPLGPTAPEIVKEIPL